MCNFESINLKLPYLTASTSALASLAASVFPRVLLGMLLGMLLGVLLGVLLVMPLGMLLVFSSYPNTLGVRALGASSPGSSRSPSSSLTLRTTGIACAPASRCGSSTASARSATTWRRNLLLDNW